MSKGLEGQRLIVQELRVRPQYWRLKMNGNVVPVVIVTRLGIGVSNPEFYDYRLSLLSHSLARSISALTETKETYWYIAVDVRAPANIEKRIAKAIAPAKAVVWRRNPFFTGLHPVDKDELANKFGDQSIIVMRIDDDDLLHRDFVSEVRKHTSRGAALSAVTFGQGIDLTLSNMAAVDTWYPWIGAALSIQSSASELITPYDMKHTRTAEWIQRRGGDAKEVRSAPMWVRMWHQASDSTEARGFRNAGGTELRVDWAEYGLTSNNLAALQQAAQTVTTSPKRAHSFSRLEMKLAVVKQIRALRAQSKANGVSEKASRELRKDAKRLLEVLYCI
ncbi:glycosyltransferase [Mycoplana sp. MJR14]|uniref:glycosyltransferase n=1 Tax=Mycoplana sp. MJR14 TaxID=3032583 RepID=UPI0023DC9683|nr:glycosyltransferase [Mycoplana sp. MJR14]MDF1634405.1 glycosyltransferase [Mycoplana sp. MJR14]